MERLMSGTGWLDVQERGGRVAVLQPSADTPNLVVWPGGELAGGDRVWPAPEVDVFYDDGEWRCPPRIDPGSWTLARRSDEVTLTQTADGARFERRVSPLTAPAVECALPWSGYRVADEVTSDKGWRAWHVVMVPAPASVYVRDARAPVDYYRPVPVISDGWIDVTDTPPRFKVGFAPPRDGRVLLAGVAPEDPGGMVMVLAEAHPDATYVDVPPDGGPATAVQVYGSGGDGVLELEHHASVERPRLESVVWGVWGTRAERLELLRRLRA